MLKQGLQQKLQQGLSPLQIQTIKLLELPTLELEQRIKKELEENPVLDEAAPSEESEDGEPKNVSLSDYNQDDSTPSYRLYVNNQGKDLKPQYNTFSVKESFHQNLEMQLGYSDLKGDDRKIAMFVIGSIDDDGYLRRDIESLTDDIAFRGRSGGPGSEGMSAAAAPCQGADSGEEAGGGDTGELFRGVLAQAL